MATGISSPNYTAITLVILITISPICCNVNSTKSARNSPVLVPNVSSLKVKREDVSSKEKMGGRNLLLLNLGGCACNLCFPRSCNCGVCDFYFCCLSRN